MADNLPVILAIAGSDSSGAAGIQTDIRTSMAFGCYCTTVLTSITAQNSQEVKSAYALPGDIITEQFSSIIREYKIKAIKIGVLANKEITHAVISFLKQREKLDDLPPVVLDPVLLSSSGKTLLEKSGVALMQDRLLPLVNVFTPNIPEAEFLLDINIQNIEDQKIAASRFYEKMKNEGDSSDKYVIVKGGHGGGEKCIDVIFNGESYQQQISSRIESIDDRGTGCTYATAIACGIAKEKGYSLSIQSAKKYVTSALKNNRKAAFQGRGPINQSVGVKSYWS